MKKRLLVLVFMVCVVCMNFTLADLVTDGGFDNPAIPANTTSGGANCLDDWNMTGDQAAWSGLWNPNGVLVSPFSGQVVYYNWFSRMLMQTFVGVKLLPNQTYILSFDAQSSAGPFGINAAFYYGTGSGQSSANSGAGWALSDMVEAERSIINGTLYPFNGVWSSGGQFTTTINPPADDVSIHHELKISTSATISQPAADIGVIFWQDTSGAQLRLDNVKVEVFPKNIYWVGDDLGGNGDYANGDSWTADLATSYDSPPKSDNQYGIIGNLKTTVMPVIESAISEAPLTLGIGWKGAGEGQLDVDTGGSITAHDVILGYSDDATIIAGVLNVDDGTFTADGTLSLGSAGQPTTGGTINQSGGTIYLDVATFNYGIVNLSESALFIIDGDQTSRDLVGNGWITAPDGSSVVETYNSGDTQTEYTVVPEPGMFIGLALVGLAILRKQF